METMTYTDIFIDFDDTLYDTYGNAVIALGETFEHCRLNRWFDHPQVFYDAYWAANIDLWSRYAKGEISRDYLIVERFRRPLSAGCCPPERLTAESCREISDVFLAFCASKPNLVEGARQLVDYLRQKGYRLHITSNGFHEVQYKKLQACGLRDCFHTIILSEDAGANKPSRAFFDYAFRCTQAAPHATVMIGDNLQTDIVGARDAGLDTIFFNRWAVQPDGIPTHTVDRLQDIMHIL